MTSIQTKQSFLNTCISVCSKFCDGVDLFFQNEFLSSKALDPGDFGADGFGYNVYWRLLSEDRNEKWQSVISKVQIDVKLFENIDINNEWRFFGPVFYNLDYW